MLDQRLLVAGCIEECANRPNIAGGDSSDTAEDAQLTVAWAIDHAPGGTVPVFYERRRPRGRGRVLLAYRPCVARRNGSDAIQFVIARADVRAVLEFPKPAVPFFDKR